ncbi:MAG: hypothetical protein AB8I80_18670, partial [Anaerolineae bacterium]
ANTDLWASPDGSLVLYQPNAADVMAVEPASGKVRWRYRAKHDPNAPFGWVPTPQVACNAQWTPAGTVVLRYWNTLDVISSSTGELIWKVPYEGYWYCPAVCPDSSILRIGHEGTTLEKLNPKGQVVWTHDFSQTGVAHAAPLVLFPSGDTLVRTKGWLLNISPKGTVNWQKPLTDGATK